MILSTIKRVASNPWTWLAAALLLTALIYWPGLGGGWLFDDYPNIVDNPRIILRHLGLSDLLSAALSSPSSELKRPIASLSFALNAYFFGLDPGPMKTTNVIIHMINGLIMFLLTRLVLAGSERRVERRHGLLAAVIATAWMVLPINLTAVLYVVQRMESLANLFVLLALYGYVTGRRRMLTDARWGLTLAVATLLSAMLLGLMTKETAILTPLYALVVEITVFRGKTASGRSDRKIIALFLTVLVAPGILGLVHLIPIVMDPATWSTRPFDMSMRLFSELRVVADYIFWTVAPEPSSLSFYHDDFVPSTTWTTPWTTISSALLLLAVAAIAWIQRKRRPLVTMGILWFFSCQILTATIIPLELIYEHRNYFASYGLIVAAITATLGFAHPDQMRPPFRVRPAEVLVALAICYWASLTAFTATRWRDPLTLAEELALRNPESPRAQYELGRAYVIASHYKTDSPFRPAAYKVLERAANLPHASTLPEQALIFFNAKMGVPGDSAWWASMTNKLKVRVPTIEDESALLSLTTCAMQDECNLPIDLLGKAFDAALAHPRPHARLLGAYADFAWRMKGDTQAAFTAARRAVDTEPRESVYRTNLIKLAIANGDRKTAEAELQQLTLLNMGGMYDNGIASLHAAIKQMPSDRNHLTTGSTNP